MDVLYLDQHLLIVYKRAGLLTQPSPQEEKSLEQEAKAYLKERLAKKGAVFLHAVHRLDKVASGLVLFAKSSKALRRLQESFRKRDCQKIYRAVVEGKGLKGGKLQHFLRHEHLRAVAVCPSSKDAKEALLSYRVLEEYENTTLLEIELFTGRYHQIRAQFAAIGHPLLGDFKYGAKKPFKEQGIALEHHELSIKHPISQEWMTFTSASDSQFFTPGFYINGYLRNKADLG